MLIYFFNSSITDFHMMADGDANGTANLSPDGKFEFINRNLQVQYPFFADSLFAPGIFNFFVKIMKDYSFCTPSFTGNCW